ncbi:hypothetical protein E3N88_40032 [Mikania micrantha]|uniref:Uncharacterized protein n=1 Tax=Mikania micrantha TaxID=192012 RepID=A0A5N6LLI6_9ASTR|nr:hypothetical protein E3N88_40032 [Mikania micrantha]
MANEENPIEMKDEGANLAPFHPSKKRKKNKVVIHGHADGYVEQLAEQTESLSGDQFGNHTPNLLSLNWLPLNEKLLTS